MTDNIINLVARQRPMPPADLDVLGEFRPAPDLCAWLCHAAQDRDRYGAPKFSKQTGRPIFAIRNHDVQEFVDVVRRYGPVGLNVAELVAAANAGPRIAPASVAAACGVCQAKAA